MEARPRLCVGRIGSAAFFLLLACPLRAQITPGTLAGTVISSNRGLPIPGALVLLEGGPQARSDVQGTFLFEGLPPGRYRIAGVAPGCHVGTGEVELPEGSSVLVELSLPLPPEVEDGLEGWRTSREASSSERSIGALEIRKRRLRTVEEAVRAIAPDMVGLASSQAGSRAALTSRRAATLSGDLEPLLVVDGVHITDRPADVLATLNIEQVESVSVAKGSSAAWRYGLQGNNGVIVVLTRSGVEQALATGPRPEACGFRFEGWNPALWP